MNEVNKDVLIQNLLDEIIKLQYDKAVLRALLIEQNSDTDSETQSEKDNA